MSVANIYPKILATVIDRRCSLTFRLGSPRGRHRWRARGRLVRRSFSGGGWLRLISVLFDQAPHRVRRLGALADPVLDPFELQGAVVAGFLGIVGANDLDKFSIARAAAVRHHDLVIGPVEGAFSA